MEAQREAARNVRRSNARRPDACRREPRCDGGGGHSRLDATCIGKYSQAMADPVPHLAPYARIKRHVLERIESGAWAVTARVPSENQLAAQFGVSRMTARRALLELMQEGWLVRSQGLGSFVADRKPVLSLLEVRNIAEEIAERGHTYSARIHKLGEAPAPRDVAMFLDVPHGAAVFHSIIVHHDNGIPVQLEERYVNPAMAPGYLVQDFTRRTPNAYLTSVAPIESVEHVIEAVLPTSRTARRLGLTPPEACLQINRRTWSAGRVVTYARLLHPGSRYRLGGHVPVASADQYRRRKA
jgi:GntR family transcriptional regulator, histidine utilization repressor